MFTLLLQNLWETIAIAAPWLVLGLLIAGFIKAKVSSKWIAKHLSGDGTAPIIKGALIGAPLPLCSCSVIPVATQIHRSGASNGATAAFLVSTPETGVDSISLSYALLGPFMAVIRPVSAIISALVAGLSISWLTKQPHIPTQSQIPDSCCGGSKVEPSCCGSEPKKVDTASCCSSQASSCCHEEKSNCCDSETLNREHETVKMTFIQGVHYAFTQMLDDMKTWLLIGLVLSAVVMTFVPNDFLLKYQNSWWIYLLVFVASFPVYICASASTPIAASLMLSGLSPGAALIFMLAGPSTNIATLGILKQELGVEAMKLYVASLAITSILLGVLVDWLFKAWQLDIHQQMVHSHEFLPNWISIICVLILFAFGIKTIRRHILK